MKNIILALLLIPLSNCGKRQSDNLTIATSANLQFAMKEIVRLFTEETNISCDLIISSSGKLTAQIIEGAPYDVFVSADIKYPETIYEKNLAVNPPEIYAYGSLVMWTTNDSLNLTFDVLKTDAIRYIAIANPKTAPYGTAAVEFLEKTKLFEEIKGKLVYGESISQVNQFVMSKTADIGFTSKSTVLEETMKSVGQWIGVDQKYYEPIAQGVIVLNKQNREKAIKFYNFLFSDQATRILEKYGYSKQPVL